MCKISVIIPVYNAETYLSTCIESITNQTYKNLEIICVDDGSEDGSRAIVEKYIQTDSRVFLVSKENGGVSSARNKGLDVCTGDYVMFVDSDDYIELDTISYCINIINKYNVDIVRFNFIKKFSHIQLKNNSYFEYDKVFKYPYSDIVEHIYTDDNFCSACQCLIKSNIAKQVFFREDVSIGEDFLYFMTCLFYSKQIYISDDYKYYYVFNQNSATQSFDFQKYLNSIKGLLLVIDEINKIVLNNIENSNEKIKRNIGDYFDLCFVTKGLEGVIKLKNLILNDKELYENLLARGIDIRQFGKIAGRKKIILIVKKAIKRII